MKKKLLVLFLGIVLIGVVIMAIFLHRSRVICEEKNRLIQETINHVESMEKDALFLSMYPLETYDEEVLYNCLQADTKILKVSLKSGEELVGLLEEILSRPNKLSRVFLGVFESSLTTESLHCKCTSYESEWISQGYNWEEAILEIGKAYPDIIFEIMFYYPQMSYWTEMNDSDVGEMLDWYAYAGELYSHHDIVQNVLPYMPACEEWLICNGSNYQDEYNVTAEVAKELEKMVLCDYDTILTPDTIQKKCGKLRELIEKYKDSKIKYNKRSKQTYVFLGDSVIGNYTGSLSIPGVVAYMTGTDTINCGCGGLAATEIKGENIGISGILDYLFLDGTEEDLSELTNRTTQEGIMEFWEKDIPKNSSKVTFFISFGINDCATKYPVYNDDMDNSCYFGALTNAVDRLRESYPKAKIVLMTPNYVEFFVNDIAEKEAYEIYIDAVQFLAKEKGLHLIDVYNELGITAENSPSYLADGIHPNYYGRFKIGELIWKHMQ